MSDSIQLTQSGGVATLVLHRPEKLNAFAGDMREVLLAALDDVATRADARVLVVTGAGRAFSAGGDVRVMAELAERGAAFEELEPMLRAGRAVIRRLASLAIPTLAAVNGPAAGAGLNLALACDLRIASDAATFGESFVKIGLHPDWGGTWFLPRRVGLSRALALCWTGDVVDAHEAGRIGLVDRVVPTASFADEIATFAARLAAAPQTSVREVKRSLHTAFTRDLDACLDAEIEAQAACWASADVKEGLQAFAEKRAPEFGAPPRAATAHRFE
jgi:2-(1,2-epoxy-1,2-dihydrophenyl)acetyl-CoA isomerase